MRLLALPLLALVALSSTLGAQPSMVPELRALVVPADEDDDWAVIAELAAAANFNTLLVTLRQQREATEYRIPEALLEAAERWGLEVQCQLQRLVSGDPGEDVWLAQAHIRGMRQIARDHPLAGLVIDASRDVPREAVADLAVEAPELPLLGITTFWENDPREGLRADGEALTWTDLGLIDQLIARHSGGDAGAVAEAALLQSPPHFAVASVVRWRTADDALSQIEAIRRYPCTGIVVQDIRWMATEDFRTLRDGPFATPAFPPSRDWIAATRIAVEQAAASEDVPEVLAEGLDTFIRALRRGTPSELQIHRVLDHLISVGDSETLTNRHLEFALMCLRHHQADQLAH
ncbi:hypothetical protein JXA47_09525 [Candidatus Sumerlaeota bacterium]|nr:hypothetical protein [Candidatus Sumerlaeota bacterium]